MQIEFNRPYTRGEIWYVVETETNEEYFVRVYHQNNFIAGKWIKKIDFLKLLQRGQP